jgi:lipopolysaccharide export LptBFGC system permease protein LptF
MMRVISRNGKKQDTFGMSNIIIKRLNDDYFISVYNTAKQTVNIPIADVLQIEQWKTND